MKSVRVIIICLIFSVLSICFRSCSQGPKSSPFIGTWAFRLPDGYPAWLGVTPDSSVSLLWSIGGAKPATNVVFHEGKIAFYRGFRWQPYGEQDAFKVSKPIVGQLVGKDQLTLTVIQSFGEIEDTLVITGKRMPTMPAKPELSKVRFGTAVDLLAEGLEGWTLTNPNKTNGWSLEEATLFNESTNENFFAYGTYGNIRTIQEYYDFELTLEYNIPLNGNSGIFLRGAYEVQVVDRDSRMQGIQGPGAVFDRIEPTENMGKAGGEWNHLQILLVDRHITVILNGHSVIENEPLEGCTGGGINADDTAPGPVLLQGDHTSVKYRNMVLRPVVAQ